MGEGVKMEGKREVGRVELGELMEMEELEVVEGVVIAKQE